MEEKALFPHFQEWLRQPRFIVLVALLLLTAALIGIAAMTPAENAPPPGPVPAGVYPAPGGAAMPMPLAQATGRIPAPNTSPPNVSLAPPRVELRPSTTSPGYAWLLETVDPQPYSGYGTSLALDGQDRPHIAYKYAVASDLRYASFDGARWVTQTVDAFGLTGTGPSLVLDATDRPHIAYRISGSYMDLLYARTGSADTDGVFWITTTVDTPGDAGIDPSLVVDAAGNPHISYNRNSCLMYASYDSSSWQIETVACGTGWYGWFTSLELDALGYPRISYQASWPTDDLLYAWYDGAQWQHELVEGAGMVGYYTSLELDAQGRPHISYYDDTLQALKYAWHDGTAWHITIVDGGGVGTYSSLVLDAADHPHISYHDKAHYGLRYAYFDGTRWFTETVDAEGDYTGLNTSLALDAAGRPHISYRGSIYWLRYAHMIKLPYLVFLPWIER
jgi:hypothetical protein